MFHSTALYRPATGAEKIYADVQAVEEIIRDMYRTGKARAYYAGRSRTRKEWEAFVQYQLQALRG